MLAACLVPAAASAASSAPRARITITPKTIKAGKLVKLSASRSRCRARPCRYLWAVGTRVSKLRSVGRKATLKRRFGAGRRVIRLTVRDRHGRRSRAQKTIRVAALGRSLPPASSTPTPATPVVRACTETITTSAQLQSRALSAPDGAVLCLTSGSYGPLSIRNSKRADYLTIQPAPGASVTLRPFYLNTTSYYRITGFAVPGAGDDTTQLWKSNHLEISGNVFSTHGLLIRGVKDSLIGGNTISDIADGASAPAGYGMWVNSYISPTDPDNGLTGLVIRGNTFHNIPEDGIQLGGGNDYGTANVLIEGNRFDTIGATSSAAHSDSIQIIGGDRITVRGNTFRHVQDACMWGDDTLSNSVVENNLMIGDTDARSGVGILCQIWDAPNLVVRNNTIIQYGTYPGLMLRGSGSAVVENNLFNKYDVESGVSVTSRNNLEVPASYGFVGDFELPAGSAAIDAANDNAPAIDRLGRGRVDIPSARNAGGGAADIGANERQ